MFPVFNQFLDDLGVNVLKLNTHFSELDPAQLWQLFISCQEMSSCDSHCKGQIFIFRYKMISYLMKAFRFPYLSTRLV